MARRPGEVPPRTELEYLLWQRAQTYDEVVAEFTGVARELGEPATLTSRHLRRLASGERNGVTPVTRRVLHVMFGQPAEDLLAPLGQNGDLIPVSRGLVIPRPLAPTTEEMLTLAAQRARKFALLAGQSELADETLEQIYDDVRQLVAAYPQRPLASILADLVTTQDTVFTLLETRRRPAARPAAVPAWRGRGRTAGQGFARYGRPGGRPSPSPVPPTCAPTRPTMTGCGPGSAAFRR